MVPGHNVPGARLDDNRFLLTESAQARRDRLDVADASIAGVGLDAGDGHMKGLERGSDGRAVIFPW